MPTMSGPNWVERFPTSRLLDDLAEPFRTKTKAFYAAMTACGMHVEISATYRPVERAYLMHYAWQIAREGLPLAAVPPMHGVDIVWNWSGGRGSAEAMVLAYGIAYEPALQSRHIDGLAVDWTIGWDSAPSIRKPDGSFGKIVSLPRSGDNGDLQHIGGLYGVYKLVSDPPHWSSDGH